MIKIKSILLLLVGCFIFLIPTILPARGDSCPHPDLADVYFSAPGIEEYPLNTNREPLSNFSLSMPLAPGAIEGKSFTLRNDGPNDLDLFVHISGEHVPDEFLADPYTLQFATSTSGKEPYYILSPATGEEVSLTAGELPAGGERTVTLNVKFSWVEDLAEEDMLQTARYRYKLGFLANCSEPSPNSSETTHYSADIQTDSSDEAGVLYSDSRLKGLAVTGVQLLWVATALAGFTVVGLILIIVRRSRIIRLQE